jgi:hypothetical protein
MMEHSMVTSMDSNAPTQNLHDYHWTDDQVAVWSHISWSAVSVGVAIALATQLLLSILGAGIGFSVIGHDLATAEQVQRSSLGVGLWWIDSSVLAVYLGAWSASELAPPGTERSGALQGITVWALATVIGVLLAGALASGVSARLYAVGGTTIFSATTFDGSVRDRGAAPGSQRNPDSATANRNGDDPQQVRVAAEAVVKASARTSFMLFVGGLLGVIAAAFGGVHNRATRMTRYTAHFTTRSGTLVR